MSMTYTIETSQKGDYLHEVVVRVLQGEAVLLEGRTRVATDDEQVAYDYAENIFLPDLRRCYEREIGALDLPIDHIPPTIGEHKGGEENPPTQPEDHHEGGTPQNGDGDK